MGQEVAQYEDSGINPQSCKKRKRKEAAAKWPEREKETAKGQGWDRQAGRRIKAPAGRQPGDHRAQVGAARLLGLPHERSRGCRCLQGVGR